MCDPISDQQKWNFAIEFGYCQVCVFEWIAANPGYLRGLTQIEQEAKARQVLGETWVAGANGDDDYGLCSDHLAEAQVLLYNLKNKGENHE